MPHIVTIFGVVCGLVGAALAIIHEIMGHSDRVDLYIAGGLLMFGAYLIQNGKVADLVDKAASKLPFKKDS